MNTLNSTVDAKPGRILREPVHDNKGANWDPMVFLAFKRHHVTKPYKNIRLEPPDVVNGAQQ